VANCHLLEREDLKQPVPQQGRVFLIDFGGEFVAAFIVNFWVANATFFESLGFLNVCNPHLESGVYRVQVPVLPFQRLNHAHHPRNIWQQYADMRFHQWGKPQ
jgi:hypothetical protein